MKGVTLKIITSYVVTGSTDEWGNDEVKGYYENRRVADVVAEKAGWYNSPGKVIEKEMLQDGAGNLYSYESVGRFTDVDEREEKKILSQIKAKLTPQEWAFYESQIKSK